MDEPRLLDRETIEKAFRLVGQYLLDRKADRVLLGLYPSPESFGLRVTAARPPYLLAMKLKALERITSDDRDYDDARRLSRECGVSTVDGLGEVFRQFFPDETIPTRAEARLGDLVDDIQKDLR